LGSESVRRDVLPIAIVGAGPIGLALAAHLVGCGKRFIIFEAGPEAGHAIRQWQHVRLFTEWPSNIDIEAEQLLLAAGWRPALQFRREASCSGII
jgi:NADPH-dependent 2,4-dienoyl-CoA reductase/sulfur reductase-like enzyme